jgi:hypothetical protein
MSYTNFDRHEHMKSETRTEIMNIIRDIVEYERVQRLENMLYGLFDGYLYDEILTISKKEVSSEIHQRIKKVVEIVKKYPKRLGY